MKTEEFTDRRRGDRFKLEFEVGEDGHAQLVGADGWFVLGPGSDALRGAEVHDLVRASPPLPVRETWVLEDVPLPCEIQPGDVVTCASGAIYVAAKACPSWSTAVFRVQRRVKP